MAQRLSVCHDPREVPRLPDVRVAHPRLRAYPASAPIDGAISGGLNYGDPAGTAWGRRTDPVGRPRAALLAA